MGATLCRVMGAGWNSTRMPAGVACIMHHRAPAICPCAWHVGVRVQLAGWLAGYEANSQGMRLVNPEEHESMWQGQSVSGRMGRCSLRAHRRCSLRGHRRCIAWRVARCMHSATAAAGLPGGGW